MLGRVAGWQQGGGPQPVSREPLPHRLHRVGDPDLGLEAVTSGRASANRVMLGNVERRGPFGRYSPALAANRVAGGGPLSLVVQLSNGALETRSDIRTVAEPPHVE